jgi:NAD(P)-dependent dehydrogenase (short-subunit alcohol dehydrogenase family)
MQMGLAGKVAVVTGGSAGIGKGIVEMLLEEGCMVATCGRTRSKLEKLESDFAVGDRLFTGVADTANSDQVNAFAAAVADKFGGIDIWVNNAGIDGFEPLADCSQELWDKILAVNLTGVWQCSKTAIHYMRRKKSGSIINISSFTSIVASAKIGAYSVTKSAVNALTRAMAGEIAPDGIRINCVAPGMIATDLTENLIDGKEEKLLSLIALLSCHSSNVG